MSNEIERDCLTMLHQDPDGTSDQVFVDFYADGLLNTIAYYENLYTKHDFMADKVLIETWRGKWLEDGYTHKQVADMADAFRSVFRHNHGKPNAKLKRARFVNRFKRMAMVEAGF